MRREVSALEALSALKAAVPKVYEHNTHQFQDLAVELFLIMEHIPGETLKAIIERGPLAVEKATDIVRKLAKTMELAFKGQPILHRDLKPSNIIVRDLASSDVVIIDYGLSFNADDDEGTVTHTDETIKNSFLALPEMYAPGGDMRDTRSDITALCAILFYCLTGQRPGLLHDGNGVMPHMRPGRSLRDTLRDDQRLRGLELFFNSGLNPVVELRFQSLDEFLIRLGTALGELAQEMEDPLVIAARSAARIRAGDRKTQLADFVSSCQQVVKSINQYVAESQQSFLKLKYHFTQSHPHAQKRLPGDTVPNAEISVQINFEGHNILRGATYAFSSKGEVCALMRRDTYRDDDGAVKEQRDWVEVFRFEGTKKPETGEAINDVKKWVGRAIQEIEAAVLAGGNR